MRGYARTLGIAGMMAALAFQANLAFSQKPKTKFSRAQLLSQPQPLDALASMRHSPNSPMQPANTALSTPLSGEQQAKARLAYLSPAQRILLPAVQKLSVSSGLRSQPAARPATAIAGTGANFPALDTVPYVSSGLPGDVNASICSVSMDVNNDGKPDIVTIQEDGVVNVLLNPGTGKFSDFAVTSRNTTAVQTGVLFIHADTADLNKDGYPDLIVMDLINNADFVYLNKKDGTFADPVEYDFPFADSGASWAEVGGVGSGSVVADVNGDGIPDLVATAFINPQYFTTIFAVQVQLGKGDGTFAAPLPEQDVNVAGRLSQQYYETTAADMNKDGKIDLVVPVVGQDEDFNEYTFLSVVKGKGDGTFDMSGFPATIPTTGALLPGLAEASYGSQYVADIDGDGNLDVLWSAVQGGVYYLALGNGDGTLQTPKAVISDAGTPTNGGPLYSNYADVNGDGIIDIIGYEVGYTVVYLGQKGGTFNPQPLVQLVSAASLQQPQPADYDGDGKVDLISVDNNDLNVGFFKGTGNGFVGTTALAPAQQPAQSFGVLAAGNFLNNGAQAVLATDNFGQTNTTGFQVVIGANDGKGNFTYQTAVTFDQVSSDNIVTVYPFAVDFNGDGLPDILMGTSYYGSDGGLMVSYNQGNGSFAAPVALSLGTTPGCSLNYVDVGDLKGNGAEDIVAAYSGDTASGCYAQNIKVQSGVYILLNDGKGNFTPSFLNFGYSAYEPKLIDLNGDGKLDLALSDVSSNLGDYLYVIPGNGDGTFNTGNSQTVLESTLVASIIPGDFDGDGKQDLTLGVTAQIDGSDDAIYGTTGLYLLKGNGDFTFSEPTILNIGRYALDGKYADLNNDGKPDLVLSETPFYAETRDFVGNLTTLVNLGGGSFAAGPQPFSAMLNGAGSHTVIADVNGDGTPDILVMPVVSMLSDLVTSTEVFINQGGDLVTLSASADSVEQDGSVTLTAAVAGTVSSASPTGTVSFYDGTTLLGTSPLSSGAATFTTAQLPVGSQTIAATYSGDANFNPGTAAASVVVNVTALPPDFTLSAPAPTTLQLQQGSSGIVNLTLTANATFSNTVTVSCSGAPTEASCSITPSTISLSASGSAQVAVLVQTTVPNNTSSAENHLPTWIKGSASLCGMLLLLWPAKRRRSFQGLKLAIILSLGMIGISSLSGCGSSGPKYPGTPAGTSTITVTATSGSASKTAQFTLTVNR